ncbi:hypothetical protein Bbelb_047760 [Branchiostoma belcheri]|nr:hypothetical protein Bbelb_047760 [Branchiostoma belcheri]
MALPNERFLSAIDPVHPHPIVLSSNLSDASPLDHTSTRSPPARNCRQCRSSATFNLKSSTAGRTLYVSSLHISDDFPLCLRPQDTPSLRVGREIPCKVCGLTSDPAEPRSVRNNAICRQSRSLIGSYGRHSPLPASESIQPLTFIRHSFGIKSDGFGRRLSVLALDSLPKILSPHPLHLALSTRTAGRARNNDAPASFISLGANTRYLNEDTSTLYN